MGRDSDCSFIEREPGRPRGRGPGGGHKASLYNIQTMSLYRYRKCHCTSYTTSESFLTPRPRAREGGTKHNCTRLR